MTISPEGRSLTCTGELSRASAAGPPSPLKPGTPVPAIVILPERLAAERERIAAAGATVLVRPYRPSELQAALPPAGPAHEEGAEPQGDQPS